MRTQFSSDELDILRHLVEPKKIKEVVYVVLNERYGFPEWVIKAIEHGWEPPYQWHKAERDKLDKTVSRMIDSGYITPGINWKLILHERLQNEMTMLALQARGPRLESSDTRSS